MRFFLFLILFSFFAKAAPSELLEAFSGENDPGDGSLVYSTVGTPDKEKLEFGKEAGHFAYGLIFNETTLPEKYKKDLGKVSLMQFTLGNFKSKVQENALPQFSSGSLFTKRVPKGSRSFEVIHNPAKHQNWDGSALFWITSPKTLANVPEDEKLKVLFYGALGSINLTPIGLWKNVIVSTGGKKIAMKRQVYQLDFNVTLSTPFTAMKKTLTGAIRVPFFQPDGKVADAFARNITSSGSAGLELFQKK